MTRAEEQKLSQAVAMVRQEIENHKNAYIRMKIRESFGAEWTEEEFEEFWKKAAIHTQKWTQLSGDLESFFSAVMFASPRNHQS